MSFAFEWPRFEDVDGFYEDAVKTLDNASALNKGKKPAIIADRINVKALNMGTIPPELEILEIGDLTRDRFRGIFRMTYTGDAYIELQTNVQANPLSNAKPDLDILPTSSVLFASSPLIVPMRLKLSDLKLHAIIVLVVSRQKGITLVFKNDPLESVSVSSSFDSVGVIQGYIQREIENQLRELFRSDLPSIIHKMSQRWLSESAALSTQGFSSTAKVKTETAFSNHVVSGPMPGQAAVPLQRTSPSKQQRVHRPTMPRLPSEMESMSVAECIESYDPTYGMRSDSLDAFRSPNSLKQFGSLWDNAASNGIKDALDEVAEPEADEDPTLDTVDIPAGPQEPPVQYETLPAVGGGVINRPRIIHSQSQIVLPSPSSSLYRESSTVSDARSTITSNRPPSTIRPMPKPLDDLRKSSTQHPQTNALPPAPISRVHSSSPSASSARSLKAPSMVRAPSYVGPPRSASRASSFHSSQDQASTQSRSASTSFSSNASPYFQSHLASSYTSMTSSRPLSPVHELAKPSFQPESQNRAHSPPPFITPSDMSSVSFDMSGDMHVREPVEGITLDTRQNDLGAHIATLSRNFQTLSPFTRDLEFFAARSFPRHRVATSNLAMSHPVASSVDGARVSARRKRLHRVGKAAAAAKEEDRQCASAPCRSPVLTNADATLPSTPTPSFAPPATFDHFRPFGSSLSSASVSDYFARAHGSEGRGRPLSRVGLR